jgi:hypothetical protein
LYLRVKLKVMKFPNEFYILLLQLIAKHPKANNEYSLLRYFAKSTYWGNEPFQVVKDLIANGFLSNVKSENGLNYYQITEKGNDLLKNYQLPEYLDTFSLEIDGTGFIRKMVYALEGKEVDS